MNPINQNKEDLKILLVMFRFYYPNYEVWQDNTNDWIGFKSRQVIRPQASYTIHWFELCLVKILKKLCTDQSEYEKIAIMCIKNPESTIAILYAKFCAEKLDTVNTDLLYKNSVEQYPEASC